MSLLIADFLIAFPEFSPAEASGMVAVKLAEALTDINEDIYGARADTAQGYLTAHLLAINALGKNARLEDDPADGTTPYFHRYRRIRRAVAPRGFVT